MAVLTDFLLGLGVPWLGPKPRTRLDKLFNGRASVRAEVHPELHGQPLSNRVLQTLAGCPAGGEVSIKLIESQVIRLLARHRRYIENENHDTNVIEIRREASGYVLYLDYIWFSKRACPEGVGAVALLRMAQTAQSLGFSRIELLAAGGSEIKGNRWAEPYWGYVAWPRFGFDAELQPPIKAFMRAYPKLAEALYVSDVIAIDLEWWREHGDGWEMTFDLQPHSKSWQTLHNYLFEKGLTS